MISTSRKIRWGRVISTVAILGMAIYVIANFIKYPEQYITTWKYQLENDVKNGDTEAIEYYTTNYLDNDKKLFEEEILKDLGVFKVTAYCSCEKCCGEWSDGYTATMTKPTAGRTVAVDPNVVPLGTEIIIGGGGKTYVAEDTGKSIKGNKVDIYFDSHETALSYGVQYLNVYIKG